MTTTDLRRAALVAICGSGALFLAAQIATGLTVSVLTGLLTACLLAASSLLLPVPVLVGLAAVWGAGAFLAGLPLTAFAILSALPALIVAGGSPAKLANDHAAQKDAQARFQQREDRLLHDLRTPLNSMNGVLEMLARRDLDARGSKYVSLGLQSVEDMTAMLQNAEDDREQNAHRGDAPPRHQSPVPAARAPKAT